MQAACHERARCAQHAGAAEGVGAGRGCACRSHRMLCDDRVLLALVWQAWSAMCLEPGDHPGGNRHLLFVLQMVMCGELGGAVAE